MLLIYLFHYQHKYVLAFPSPCISTADNNDDQEAGKQRVVCMRPMKIVMAT